MLKAPLNLRCEYLLNPIGVDTPQPRFSWALTSDDKSQKQTAFQVLVSSDPIFQEQDLGDIWDSSKVINDQSNQVEYRGRNLIPAENYFWKVRVWDENGQVTQYSDIANFEMGLMGAESWSSNWIGASEENQSPLFRKVFITNGQIKKARGYICGLGYYELYINGEKIGDHVLDPHWTDYDTREISSLQFPFDDKTTKTVPYVTYDITGLVKAGENVLGVMLGNGWYNQRDKILEGAMSYGSPRLAVQVIIDCLDGGGQTISSDATWKTSPSPLIYNNIYYGEIYDARLEQDGWCNTGFDDSQWSRALIVRPPSGKLRSQLAPPDRIIRTILPTLIKSDAAGQFIYDMRENISGWVRIRAQGKAGARVVLRYAEELGTDGSLDFSSTGNWDFSKDENNIETGLDVAPLVQIQKDEYIFKGSGVEEYQPRFTWHCFRYVEITVSKGNCSDLSIEGLVVHSDLDKTGSFSCSNELFNGIQEICKRTLLNNSHGGVPSDCPHRERLGYTGDGHVSAFSSIYNFDMSQFYTKWLNDIRDAQNKETGFVPHTAPFAGGGGGPGWGSAYILIPWYMYLYYGDKRILEEHYSGMKHWIDYLSTRTDGNNIIEREEPGGWCLGDWCTPGRTDIPARLVNTFFYGYCTRILSQIAHVLEKSEDSNYLSKLSESINLSFNKEFLDEGSGKYSIGRQGTEVFPLQWGITPESVSESVVSYLAGHLERNCNAHLDTGIFATAYLFDQLVDNGYGDLAYKILNQKDFPSYGHMIENGATTLWECWQKDLSPYNYCPSHCHSMFGSISAWFYSRIAGIRPDALSPGFKNVIISPHVLGNLTFAKATFKTLYGVIRVDWKTDDREFTVEVDIPVNCTAEIRVPKIGSEYIKIANQDKLIWDGRRLLIENGENGILGTHEGENSVSIVSGSGTYVFRSQPLPMMGSKREECII
jgi:alpha-L-rhamnosidase